MASWLPWAATTAAVLLASILLFPIIARVRRRGGETRPDGLQVIPDPDSPTFE